MLRSGLNRYLRERALFGPLIASGPSGKLNLVVVIPAKDEENLLGALAALQSCERPHGDAEVIVVVNTAENDLPECVENNAQIAEKAEHWAAEASEPEMRFHILQCHGLPRKHAGVGLARKIGMDEASRRLEQVGNASGVIACFDADCDCAANYLVEIERQFRDNEACQACSIYFEHPLAGGEFAGAVYDAIVAYELHLRYLSRRSDSLDFPLLCTPLDPRWLCDAVLIRTKMA